jgi:hypothetical protein
MHENFIDLVLGPACNIAGVGPEFYQRLEIDSGGGIVQGGSSGSGIFNNDGQLMGQALGVCGLTSVPRCDNRGSFLVAYGRFFVTFAFIQRWLEIGGTVNVNRFFGGSELGTPTQPFRTVNGANNLINDQSWDGARIRIQAGSYNEPVTFSRQMTVIANGGTVTIGAP